MHVYVYVCICMCVYVYEFKLHKGLIGPGSVIMIIRANGGRNIWETYGKACLSLAPLTFKRFRYRKEYKEKRGPMMPQWHIRVLHPRYPIGYF